MKKIASLICTVALGAGFVSCSDFLDRSDTNTNYSSEWFYQGEQAKHDGLTTIY